MSVAFKETAPNVFVGEYHHARTSQFHCLVVMQSMEQWSAYIDGDRIGSGFADVDEAQDFAHRAVEGRVRQSRRLTDTLMAFAAFAIGTIVYLAAQGGDLNAVSQALAAAISSKQDRASLTAAPVSGVMTSALIPAAQAAGDREAARASIVEANTKPNGTANADATVLAPAAPLVRQPRVNIASPPLRARQLPSPLIVARQAPERRPVSLEEHARHHKMLPRAKSQNARERLAAIKRNNQRAARARRLQTARANTRTKARANARTKATAKKQLALNRKLAQKRNAARLANIKASRRARAKRTRFTKRNRIARLQVKRRRVSPKPRHRRASRRGLTYRQYQMLRNRVIAKRIRHRRRFAR